MITFVTRALERLELLGRVTLKRYYLTNTELSLADWDAGIDLDNPDFGKVELSYKLVEVNRYWDHETVDDVEQTLGGFYLSDVSKIYGINIFDYPIKIDHWHGRFLSCLVDGRDLTASAKEAYYESCDRHNGTDPVVVEPKRARHNWGADKNNY